MLSEVGPLMREFCIVQIGTWGNDGGMRVLQLIEGNITRFYCIAAHYNKKTFIFRFFSLQFACGVTIKFHFFTAS